MNAAGLARERLFNQRLAGTPFTSPVEVVRWLGAVQAQDYGAAKWGVGLRGAGITDASMDDALADGSIIRTHVMRPTWHFVAPEDARWLLELTAPRVHAINAPYYRQAGLDDEVLGRSKVVLRKELRGGRQLTRAEIATALEAAGIATGGVQFRLSYILMQAELNRVICSGGRRGKQFTYALFDERVPEARSRAREEALGELAQRFFTGHGPATLKDFRFWCGLPAAEAREALELARPQLGSEVVNGKTFWFGETAPVTAAMPGDAFLLPAYDEYLLAYHDYDALALDSRYRQEVSLSAGQSILLRGEIVGTWKRRLEKRRVVIEAKVWRGLEASERESIEAAVERYGSFIGMPVRLDYREGEA